MPRKKDQTWETEQTIFSSKLSEIMQERKVSQEKLAGALGVKRQTVSLYKTGQSSPNAEQLGKIADFFHVSTDWLLGRSEAKSPDSDIQQICKQTGISENIVNWLRIYSSDHQNKPTDASLIDYFNIFFQEDGKELFEFLSELRGYATCAELVGKICSDIKKDFEEFKEKDALYACLFDEWFAQLAEMQKEIRYRRFECIDSLTKRFDATYRCSTAEKLIQETYNLISDAMEEEIMCYDCDCE